MIISCKKLMASKEGVLEQDALTQLFDYKEGAQPPRATAQSQFFDPIKLPSSSSGPAAVRK